MLEVLRTLNGGQVISGDVGLMLENANLVQLGQTSRVVADKENTTIIGGKGNSTQIKARVQQIRREIEKTPANMARRSWRNGWQGFPGASR